VTDTNPDLEVLVLVQDQDTILDQLRHRRASLPVRAELDAALAAVTASRRAAEVLREQSHEVEAEERRLDDEAQSLAAKAKEVDAKLYSGTVTSPRELQALQTDLEMLRRHQREIEDRELERMEARERAEEELAQAEAALAARDADVTRLRADLGAAEAELDAEIEREEAVRAQHASGIPPALVADYERRRAKNRGFGIARLVGDTCQACHLSIPATEVERIRRTGGDPVASCDNCGAILVP
jgi:predicted  nucleic acid-binding Zn-ribbon protein